MSNQQHKTHKEPVEDCWYCNQEKIFKDVKKPQMVVIPKGSKPFVRKEHE